jgi:hypothetical protein
MANTGGHQQISSALDWRVAEFSHRQRPQPHLPPTLFHLQTHCTRFTAPEVHCRRLYTSLQLRRIFKLGTPGRWISRPYSFAIFWARFWRYLHFLLVVFVWSARLDDIEGKNYLETLLANSPSSLVMTQNSQNSAPVSSVSLSSILVAFISVGSVLTGPPPPLPRRAPVVVRDWHWNNDAVRVLL